MNLNDKDKTVLKFIQKILLLNDNFSVFSKTVETLTKSNLKLQYR